MADPPVELTELIRGGRVQSGGALDLGCGPGVVTGFLATRFRQQYLDREELEDRLRIMLKEDATERGPSIARLLDQFAGWLDGAEVVVRFEDLIGSAGGGDEETQRATLARLFGALGLETDPAFLSALGAKLFSSSSPTFRRGAMGGWRKDFDPETEARFNAAVGDRLDRYGYGGHHDG